VGEPGSINSAPQSWTTSLSPSLSLSLSLFVSHSRSSIFSKEFAQEERSLHGIARELVGCKLTFQQYLGSPLVREGLGFRLYCCGERFHILRALFVAMW